MPDRTEPELWLAEASASEAAELEARLLNTLGTLLPQSVNANYRWAARDSSGEIIGGITASTSYGWLLIKILWVHEDFRGQGLGHRLMDGAENWARELDCHGAWLETSGARLRRRSSATKHSSAHFHDWIRKKARP